MVERDLDTLQEMIYTSGLAGVIEGLKKVCLRHAQKLEELGDDWGLKERWQGYADRIENALNHFKNKE